MGLLVKPIDMACNPLERFGMGAEFELFSRDYLVKFGLVEIDCEKAWGQGEKDCVICLWKSEDFFEQLCMPLVEHQIVQTIYKCNNIKDNNKFTIRTPRVDGHQNFTINGINHSYNNRVSF